MNFKVNIVILILAIFSVNSASLYGNQNSNIINLNPKNFDTQITSTRAKNTISFIHFYSPKDGKSQELKKEIDSMAMEYDGMFKFTALNCMEFKELCEKQDIREYPAFKIYPPLPAPVFPYEGEIVGKSIISALGRFVESKVIEVHSNNVDSFTTEPANLPKILLFSDKEGIPLIYKVLSVQFDKKMNFGIVRKSESAIVSKYKVNKYPRIIVLPVGAKKHDVYEGANKFKNIFDFLNVYSETFFKVGEDKTKASEETKADKPWLMEKFPEINNLSGNDICFKVDGILCVILVSNGNPSKKVMDLMDELQNYLSPKIDRGIKYKFGWMNSETQSKFIKTIEINSIPSLLIVNPGKRKRFYVSDEELKMDYFQTIFEKLASGDLRFKMFPDNNFPELAE